MSREFRVVALIAARNEADIISQVIEDLIRQHVDVFLIDDGSTDDTVREASRWIGRGLIDIERRAGSSTFDWTGLLTRKQELALSLDADWFIHHDADEFRESPWPDRDLRDAIQEVDELGYNAIDFRLLQFRLTNGAFAPGSDVRDVLQYYEPPAHWEALQTKCWKRGEAAPDLVSSAGHEAVFPNRRIFPLQFLLRHYPIRSEEQGRRKIFQERLPRFLPAERSLGWHIQYNGVTPGMDLIRDASSLRRYDAGEVKRALQITHRDSARVGMLEAEVRDLRGQLGTSAAGAAADRAALVVAEEARSVAEQGRTSEARARQAAESRHSAELASLRDLLSRERAEHAERLRTTADQTVELEREIRNRHAELDAVYRSASWRVTFPIRAVYDLALARRPQRAAAQAPGLQAGAGRVDFGELRRTVPISTQWGFDRGQPIDRYYVERFLLTHASDIRGRVLEIGDAAYTTRFGTDRVSRSDVLNLRAGAGTTIVANLESAPEIPDNTFDCVIATQTLQLIFNLPAAIGTLHRVLRPGGVLLISIPGVTHSQDPEWGSRWCWSFTRNSVHRLLDPMFAGRIGVEGGGNVLAAASFLYGLAAEELTPAELDYADSAFDVTITARAVK